MAEDPQPMTLQQRIASLNAAHIGRVPGDPPLPRPKPQIPQKRPVVIRQKSINNPPERVTGSVIDVRVGNLPAGIGRANGLLPPPPSVTGPHAVRSSAKTPPPALPKRQPNQLPPPLPARKTSTDVSRRGSEDSSNSGSGSGGSEVSRLTATRTKSNDSTSSRVKAPAWGEVDLPALPLRGSTAAPRKYSTERPKYVNRAPSCADLAAAAKTTSNEERPPVPSLPPRLPSRNASATREGSDRTTQPQPSRNTEPTSIPPVPPIPKQTAAVAETIRRSALSLGLNKPPKPPVPAQSQTNGNHTSAEPPPPIPISSRPDLSAIQLTKPRPSSIASLNTTTCLVCRDFSGPDSHAARFPRQTVSSLPALAETLTTPFPSPTDKARAIFTWLHHNVAYNTVDFFNGNLKPSTPMSTLQSGLAVCEGYAVLFANLATHAGLDALVISGHGKGYGYAPLGPNSPIPPYNAGHAWSAVRIDNGEWKLIDPCWGAGHVQGKGMPYVKMFHSEQFTMSNEEFFTKHFPGNKDHFFLPNGKRPTWEEYIVINPAVWPDLGDMEPCTVFTNAKVDYGIGERTITPRGRKINVRSPDSIRFSFRLLCPHWTLQQHTRKGLPPVFMLATGGLDGRNKDQIPLEYVRGRAEGGGGDAWYVDVPARELGAPGQSITLCAVTSFAHRQDARGLSVGEFREGKGRVGMGFMGVASWDLF